MHVSSVTFLPKSAHLFIRTYQNREYGENFDHSNVIVNLNNVNDLKLLAYGDGSRPILKFDGPGGIIGGNVAR